MKERKPLTESEVKAQAATAKEFIDSTLETANRLKMSPELTLNMFGMIARGLLASLVGRGMSKADAMDYVMREILIGLGARPVRVSLPDDAAEALGEAMSDTIASERAATKPIH